jgi:hypothetical protein
MDVFVDFVNTMLIGTLLGAFYFVVRDVEKLQDRLSILEDDSVVFNHYDDDDDEEEEEEEEVEEEETKKQD